MASTALFKKFNWSSSCKLRIFCSELNIRTTSTSVHKELVFVLCEDFWSFHNNRVWKLQIVNAVVIFWKVTIYNWSQKHTYLTSWGSVTSKSTKERLTPESDNDLSSEWTINELKKWKLLNWTESMQFWENSLLHNHKSQSNLLKWYYKFILCKWLQCGFKLN